MIRRHDSMVIQHVARFLIPLIQIFGLYVFFHGHYSPGGGFQGGVLIGASIILRLLIDQTGHMTIRREFLWMCVGLSIYLVIGTAALLAHSPYLDYGVLKILAAEPAMRRYWGILIAEGGVMIVVAMTLVVIFHTLAFPGDKDTDSR